MQIRTNDCILKHELWKHWYEQIIYFLIGCMVVKSKIFGRNYFWALFGKKTFRQLKIDNAIKGVQKGIT